MRLKNGKPVIARRTLLVAGAALSVLSSRRAFSQLSEPLKVGFLTVLTGPLAAGGKRLPPSASVSRIADTAARPFYFARWASNVGSTPGQAPWQS
jgi:hypothetical protein